jgi:PAS domain S-box-containing protein
LHTKATYQELEQRVKELEKEAAKCKMREEVLRTSEAKYRELVQNVNSIILRRDTKGNVTFFNEFAQNFFGFHEDEILGQNVVGKIVPKSDSSGQDLEAMIEDIGRQPEKYINNENENIRCNGERVWISWTNKGIIDDNGHIAEIMCIGNDITRRKRAEEEREELILELEDALAQVKTLRGLLPICTNCKKIRDDRGYWNQIEVYIRDHSEAEFSHSICPECAKKLYPEFYNRNSKELRKHRTNKD